MRLKKFIKKYFLDGNVCVVGLRGRGKDMLFANVIKRRKSPYISNCDYNCSNSPYIPLDLKKLDVKNNWKQLANQNIIPYDYPYPEGCDIYISDVGIYFPAQYCNELNKEFPNIATFEALSRQLAQCNVHLNCQNLNRIWDKMREQSDTYIMCNSCFVFPRLLSFLKKRLVLQVVTTYDKAEACQNRVEPFRPIRLPLFNKAGQREIIKAKNEELKRAFNEKNGTVKRHLLLYWNKSKYDTRLFKNILKGDRIENYE